MPYVIYLQVKAYFQGKNENGVYQKSQIEKQK